MLIGMRDDDDVALAGSPHAHVRACWIHACTHLQGMHARTHALGLYMHARTGPVHAARTGPMHARMHRAYACTHAPGLCTLLALGPHAHSLVGPMHACLHRVPTPASSLCTHAPSLGPHAHSLTGPMHARTHQVSMPAHSWGPHTRTHQVMRACMRQARHACSHACTGPMRACSLRVPTPEGSPCMHALGLCTLDCEVPMHVCQIPALVHAASHVVCSSSYM